MTALELQNALIELIDLAPENEETADVLQVSDVRSFEEAGLMTTNKGIIINTKDRSIFQITIVKKY
jgi:hypothetical protein